MPLDDSLAAVSWMQRALAVVAADLLESSLSDKDKRGELLKIADHMAKLVGPDRMYQARVRSAARAIGKRRRGPARR